MTNFKTLHPSVNVKRVCGRYITNEHIFPFLESLGDTFLVETIGHSVLGKSIKSVTFGSGKTRVFMWSQMHGNESTTTKAVLDFLNYIETKSDFADQLLQECTFKIIPILNPDGAAAYSRVNANGIDLNRDAQQRTQPESILLRKAYEDFQPNYCFNLHDQRTIFSVGESSKPATVSFLAPAANQERTISASRAISMQIIVAMYKELEKYIPNQIGRYDDGFNANCIGDTFQMLETPTVLFEAGHFPGDYQREETRIYIFCALLKGVTVIAQKAYAKYSTSVYAQIPENGKQFYDVLIWNVEKINSNFAKNTTIGVLFKETLIDGNITFVPQITEKGLLKNCYGHLEYNCKKPKDLKVLKEDKILFDLLVNFE